MNIHKSVGPDEMHPRVLRELADAVAKPLFIVEKSLQSGEGPRGWRKGNITANFRKDNKVDPGTYRPVSHTSGPSKTMEWILLEAVSRHMEDREAIKESSGREEERELGSNLASLY